MRCCDSSHSQSMFLQYQSFALCINDRISSTPLLFLNHNSYYRDVDGGMAAAAAQFCGFAPALIIEARNGEVIDIKLVQCGGEAGQHQGAGPLHGAGPRGPAIL